MLACQELQARIERDRDTMQLQIQQAEALRKVSLLEAEAEELRMAKLEERLRAFPHAAQYDQDFEHFRVSRALVGNVRPRLQAATSDYMAHSLAVPDTLQHPAVRAPATRDVAS